MPSEEEILKKAQAIVDVPLHQFMGIKLVSVNATESRLLMTTTASVLTPANNLNGGCLCAAFEAANGVAYTPHLAKNEHMVSIDHSLTFLATVYGEGKEVLIKARMLKRGKSVAFMESEAIDVATGTILAKGKTLKAIVQIPDIAKKSGKSKL